MTDNELASKLRTSITRLVKVIRSEVEPDNLFSETERSTLMLIYKKSAMLPSELAAKEKVTSQAMSQIINKLSQFGLVEKTPSQDDKRKVIVSITTKGKEVVEYMLNKKMEWLAQAISQKVNDDERETLLRAIDILTKLVD